MTANDNDRRVIAELDVVDPRNLPTWMRLHVALRGPDPIIWRRLDEEEV